MKTKKVAVFTGSRAEFGLQYPLLRAISESEALEYVLIVSGAHLDGNFGDSIQEIKNSGFKVHSEVTLDLLEDSLVGTAQAIGTGIVSISKALQKLAPDVLLVYGDRFETFAAAIAASQMGIPIAHVEGGDLTEGGALDDSVRHAISKLSHIHFTTNIQATNRLLAMGEESWRVHTVGLPSIDSMKIQDFATPQELVAQYGIKIDRPLILFTQHSITTEIEDAVPQIQPSLAALKLALQKGYQVVMTYPNSDAGGQRILTEMKDFFHENTCEDLHLEASLGRYRYHGMLALSKYSAAKTVCVGNSSSGIKETPEFFCPTVNIGTRQNGRLRGENVLDTGYDEVSIFSAIEKCLTPEFRQLCEKIKNPYGDGTAGKKVVQILSELNLGKRLIQKMMTLEGTTQNGWYR